jgi:hypothetical protein
MNLADWDLNYLTCKTNFSLKIKIFCIAFFAYRDHDCVFSNSFFYCRMGIIFVCYVIKKTSAKLLQQSVQSWHLKGIVSRKFAMLKSVECIEARLYRKWIFILADIHGMDHFCTKLAPPPYNKPRSCASKIYIHLWWWYGLVMYRFLTN